MKLSKDRIADKKYILSLVNKLKETWTSEEISKKVALTDEDIRARGYTGNPDQLIEELHNAHLILTRRVAGVFYYVPNLEHSFFNDAMYEPQDSLISAEPELGEKLLSAEKKREEKEAMPFFEQLGEQNITFLLNLGSDSLSKARMDILGRLATKGQITYEEMLRGSNNKATESNLEALERHGMIKQVLYRGSPAYRLTSKVTQKEMKKLIEICNDLS